MKEQTVPQQQPATPPVPAKGAGGGGAVGFILRYGVFVVFAAMVATFAVLNPTGFVQIGTLRAILVDAAILGVVAAALTLVLAIGEFDLSFGSVAGFSGAIAVYAMHSMGLPIAVAVLAALAVGAAAGAVNGVIVAWGRVPALIATLAMGSVVVGLERALWRDNTIYDGIPAGYMMIAETRLLGLPSLVWLSLLAAGALSLVASFTTFGRRIYAVGGSEEAARIAGIRTLRLRFATFLLMGLVAGIAGVLLTSQAASYFPRSGAGLLLPAYAACFLGWSAANGSRFYPAYTYFGVIFMGTLSTGLLMLQVPSYVNDLLQGTVLASAVLLARASRR